MLGSSALLFHVLSPSLQLPRSNTPRKSTMGHTVESSNNNTNNRTTRKAPYPPHKPKTPDKPNHQHTNTPPPPRAPTHSQATPSSPAALSYASASRPSTPTQTLGKRTHDGHDDGARPPPTEFHTPNALRTYTSPNHLSAQIDPCQFEDAPHGGSDHEMEGLDTGVAAYFDAPTPTPNLFLDPTDIHNSNMQNIALNRFKSNLRDLSKER